MDHRHDARMWVYLKYQILISERTIFFRNKKVDSRRLDATF